MTHHGTAPAHRHPACRREALLEPPEVRRDRIDELRPPTDRVRPEARAEVQGVVNRFAGHRLASLLRRAAFSSRSCNLRMRASQPTNAKAHSDDVSATKPTSGKGASAGMPALVLASDSSPTRLPLIPGPDAGQTLTRGRRISVSPSLPRHRTGARPYPARSTPSSGVPPGTPGDAGLRARARPPRLAERVGR